MRDLKATDYFQAISPIQEAAAYEALWDQEGATVHKIAAQFKAEKNPLLSHLLSKDNITQYIERLKELIKKDPTFEFCFIGEADYPKQLQDDQNLVPLLYFKGAWDLVFSKCIAVVGTRHPTKEGISRTRKLVKMLVEDGFTIVSGLAKGIDTAAHQTAIEERGNTIAVIGTPINEYYPKENQSLQDKIAKNFLLISQVPFVKYSKQDYRLNRFFFPERNKLMSTLSLATIIVEAGETSGTLIQAKAALKQGRKVFILNNNFENKSLTWPEKLHQLGAIRVNHYDDIKAMLTHA